MTSVKIYGAGSIGNHLAHACRERRWDVLVCDSDESALERMRHRIYPDRYGAWDPQIRLVSADRLKSEPFDVVIIGTPPESHVPLALDVLGGKSPPKVLLVEKPLATPSLERCQELAELGTAIGAFVGVGYNHVLTANTVLADRLIDDGTIGDARALNVEWIEHWGGIFDAHPWLAGPRDSYLGFTSRGGGASCEHSHGINIWQHVAARCGAGRVTEVTAMWDTVDTGGVAYDRVAVMAVRTDRGLTGSIVQDVVSEPPVKRLALQGSAGRLEWMVNREPGLDSVHWWTRTGGWSRRDFSKTRPDDFRAEIAHVAAILEKGEEVSRSSPISLVRGLETMLLIAAARLSAQTGRAVGIDYAKGFTSDAIVT